MTFYRCEELLRLKHLLLQALNQSYSAPPTDPTATTDPSAPSHPAPTPLPTMALAGPYLPSAASSLLPHQRILITQLKGPHGTDIINAVLSSLSKHKCSVDDFMFARTTR